MIDIRCTIRVELTDTHLTTEAKKTGIGLGRPKNKHRVPGSIIQSRSTVSVRRTYYHHTCELELELGDVTLLVETWYGARIFYPELFIAW